ncbi:MAG: hypothetical protein J6Z32_04085, partial [Bacteroidales bacterium]|nr:hypothetical protein [Bacteroidales bacterium]
TLPEKYRVRLPSTTSVFSTDYISEASPTTAVQPYKLLYNGKELQLMAQTPLIDYGARQYNPVTTRWNAPDPMSEKYYSTSAYAYCIGNPINHSDLYGLKIDENSKEEWTRLTTSISNRRDELQNDINRLENLAKEKKWSSKKLARKIGDKKERVSSLNESIKTFKVLEESTQVYALKQINGIVGNTSYDSSSDRIILSYTGTANFVHEAIHAGQFETQDLAFTLENGLTFLQDVFDEIHAYKAQFAYEPESVSSLQSSSIANSFNSINKEWVLGINNGKLYGPETSNNTGLVPLNINSTKEDLIRAYPNNPIFKSFPNNTTVKNYLSNKLKYKK